MGFSSEDKFFVSICVYLVKNFSYIIKDSVVSESCYIFLPLDLGWWCGLVVKHSTLFFNMWGATPYSTQEEEA
jgi:hypothetical protein